MYDELEYYSNKTRGDYLQERLDRDLKNYIRDISFINPTRREIDSFLNKYIRGLN